MADTFIRKTDQKHRRQVLLMLAVIRNKDRAAFMDSNEVTRQVHKDKKR